MPALFLASVPSVLSLAVFVLFDIHAHAAQLLAPQQPGCPWCARFNANVAPIWPKTDEGRGAPSRRVDITKVWSANLSAVAKEIGRLHGYPGDEFFWSSIDRLLAELPPKATVAN